MFKNLPRLGLTMGDPKGIGPEVIQKVLRSPLLKNKAYFILFGDKKYFDYQKAKKLSAKQCGQICADSIEQAAHAALSGQIDAIVTGPICKEHFQLAGYPYPGHTEFLADIAHIKDFRMMMAGPKLKVILVTIHEPIKKISELLTQEKIFKTITITHHALKKWFGILKPRIAVAALNPHAGESGIFGNEEKTKIMPAIRKARRKKINAQGPFSPDTIFYRTVHGEFDAVVVMYHDQGLIPLKLLHFEEAVNITLGLPFIRTSVDHGTAFDIAGKGIAKTTSMIAAIQLALKLTIKNNERRKVSFRRE